MSGQYPIPEDLQRRYQAAQSLASGQASIEIALAGRLIVELIERIARLEAEKAALSEPVAEAPQPIRVEGVGTE